MIDVIRPLIKQFMPFAQKKMGFSRPPKLFLRQDQENAANPLGKTGFYDPQAESITLYTTGRHPKDVMRSLAHELMHHTQKCNGEFDNVQNMGEEGYAQNDPHMRTMEIQAYQASIVFRDWEDSCKGTIYYEHLQKGDKSSMSTKEWKNGELKSLLSEAWGFKMDLDKLTEESEAQARRKKRDRQKERDEAEKQAGDQGRKGFMDESKDEDFGKDPAAYTGTEKEEKEEKEALETGSALQEDSGEEEKRHYEDNAWNDEDHIEAIEKHLRALKKDKDYDEDHEALEEDGAKRKGDPRLRRPDADRLRENVAKLYKAGFSKAQIKEFLSNAYSKTLKG